MQNTALIIAAAGQGRRMGAQMNKQFIELKGQAILVHTLKRFAVLKDIGQVIVLHHADELEEMKALVSPIDLPFKVDYVIGGDTRQASIYNGLKAVDRKMIHVIIHDGARPFVSEDMMNQTHDFIKKMSLNPKLQGGFFGVPLKDTIKQAYDGGFKTIDRSTLHAVQTPQIFNREKLMEAHESAYEAVFLGTDDCSLIERVGGHIELLKGDYWNIKVTTPEDLLIAETFMKLF